MSSNRTKRKRQQRVKAFKAFRPIVIKAVNYDATRSPSGLQEHWRYADSRSVDASLSPDVRQTLRERARYEIANNSYAFGLASTIANNVIGTGPRLQILDKDSEGNESEYAKEIEWAFDLWAQEIRLAEKLRAMRFSRFQDGEAFAILYTNPRLIGEIKLDIFPVDCDRVCAATSATNDPLNIDGITIDEYGNPIKYRVLDNHPGSDVNADADKATEYDASQVIHWFRRISSEQHRGVTELAACLNLFAQLRRYTESVLTAAETAADLALVIQTDALEDMGGYKIGNTTNNQSVDEFPEMSFRKGTSLVLPEGWGAMQVKAEQPTTTYSDFKRELLGEIGRSLQIPVNIVAGDSARYNYASGRLDHQEYQKSIRLDQSLCKTSVMNPIFRAWFDEWTLVSGHRRDEDELYPPVQWYFDGFEHVDPVKEAQAQALRLASGSTNLMIECGKAGLDWEEVMAQQAREMEMKRALGLLQEVEQKDSSTDDSSNDDDDT